MARPGWQEPGHGGAQLQGLRAAGELSSKGTREWSHRKTQNRGGVGKPTGAHYALFLTYSSSQVNGAASEKTPGTPDMSRTTSLVLCFLALVTLCSANYVHNHVYSLTHLHARARKRSHTPIHKHTCMHLHAHSVMSVLTHMFSHIANAHTCTHI